MRVEVESVEELRFTDGAPVRAASAVVPYGEGFLVAQDDATHAAWVHAGGTDAVRVFPPVTGLETFGDETATKHLKPDLEAACAVITSGGPAVLLLGSGSSPARKRSVLLRGPGAEPAATAADLTPVYSAAADALGVAPDVLNLEGACVVGPRLRWFHRGLPSAGLRSGSVEVEVAALTAAVLGDADPRGVEVSDPRHYTLGEVEGVALAATDAVALPDGTILLSAAAEDSPNPRDDGPVVGSALVHLVDDEVHRIAPIPRVEGAALKVEGLMVLESGPDHARLLAVVDADDARAPSLALHLHVRW